MMGVPDLNQQFDSCRFQQFGKDLKLPALSGSAFLNEEDTNPFARCLPLDRSDACSHN